MDASLLDTDIYSEIVRGKNQRIAEQANAYRAEHSIFHLSAATVIELFQGLHQAGRLNRLTDLAAALDAEHIVPIDRTTAEIAGAIHGELAKSGQGIGRMDPIIAATAIRNDLTLVTGNIKHFERVVAMGFPLRLTDWH